MCEHHCLYKTDAAGQPRRSEMGTGIQYVHRKEDQAEVVFSDSEATEEPIGDESIGQKAAAKSVQREQSRELGDDTLAFWRDHGIHLLKGWGIYDFNGRGKGEVQSCDDQAKPGIAEKHDSVGTG